MMMVGTGVGVEVGRIKGLTEILGSKILIVGTGVGFGVDVGVGEAVEVGLTVFVGEIIDGEGLVVSETVGVGVSVGRVSVWAERT